MSRNPYIWLVGCLLGAAFLIALEVSHGFSVFDAGGWLVLALAVVTRIVRPLWER